MEEKDVNNKQDIRTFAKRSVKRIQKEREIRKERKKADRLRAFLRFIVFIIIIAGIYYFIKMPQWYLPQTAFSKPDEHTIEIINNEIIPNNILYNSLKKISVPKIPIFLMSVRPIQKELYKIPVIKRVYVRRYGFPARIQIIIRERTPVTVIKTSLKSKPLAFSTSDGVFVTNKEYMPLVETKPTLKIIVKYPNIEKDWNIKRIEQIRKIVKEVEAYSSEKVQYVNMHNPNDVYVKIETTNIRLGVLDSSVFDRIKRIYTILPQINNIDGQIKYIDLSWDKVNYLKLQSNDKNKENE